MITGGSEIPKGSYYAQDFNLEDVNLISDTGQVFKLRNLVMELSFFEDIYTFTTSGYVILRDALGLIEKLKPDGNEFIEIRYGKYKGQKKVGINERKYRLYKIGNRKPQGNQNAEYFTIYFCTEALLISEQIKVSKSYPGKKIATANPDNSGIVNNILTEYLKVDSSKIQKIEETYGVYDFVVPRMKPFEAISWLSTYARPTGNKIGADMLFFETNDGFYFRSLQSMFKDQPYTTYKYQPKNLNSGDIAEDMVSVLNYEFVKTFDALEGTSAGTYANRLISIDPLLRSYKVTDYNYEKFSGSNHLNKNNVMAPATNRLGIKQTEAYEGSLKVAFTNSNQKLASYISQNQSAVAKDIFIETYVPYRSAQLSLANYTVLKVVIPGDSAITAGRTVNFNLFSLRVDQNRKLDEHYSGKYLVTAVRHIIQTQGVYQTILELAKESSKAAYNAPSYGSINYREAIKE
jgi:hypothetical protein